MTDQELAKRVDELSSKDEIRDCVYRIVRGIDRLDTTIIATAFHDDATIQWHAPKPVPLSEFLSGLDRIKAATRQAQHLVGNVLIDLQGDKANVESYEIARHVTKMGDDWKDMVLASRYLDKFSRRNGVWKIDFRMKMMDWARVHEGADAVFDGAPLKAQRNTDDLSYQILGAKTFL